MALAAPNDTLTTVARAARSLLLEKGYAFHQHAVPGAFCVPCETYVGRDSDQLRRHLTRRHPRNVIGAVAFSLYNRELKAMQTDLESVIASVRKDRSRLYEEPSAGVILRPSRTSQSFNAGSVRDVIRCFEILRPYRSTCESHSTLQRGIETMEKLRIEKCQKVVW